MHFQPLSNIFVTFLQNHSLRRTTKARTTRVRLFFETRISSFLLKNQTCNHHHKLFGVQSSPFTSATTLRTFQQTPRTTNTSTICAGSGLRILKFATTELCYFGGHACRCSKTRSKVFRRCVRRKKQLLVKSIILNRMKTTRSRLNRYIQLTAKNGVMKLRIHTQNSKKYSH